MTEYVCPECGFKAATSEGLNCHMTCRHTKRQKIVKQVLENLEDEPLVKIRISRTTADLLIDFALEELAKRRA